MISRHLGFFVLLLVLKYAKNVDIKQNDAPPEKKYNALYAKLDSQLKNIRCGGKCTTHCIDENSYRKCTRLCDCDKHGYIGTTVPSNCKLVEKTVCNEICLFGKCNTFCKTETIKKCTNPTG